MVYAFDVLGVNCFLFDFSISQSELLEFFLVQFTGTNWHLELDS